MVKEEGCTICEGELPVTIAPKPRSITITHLRIRRLFWGNRRGRGTYNSVFGFHQSFNTGIKYNPLQALTFRVNYGTGFKTPSFKDLYYEWEHPSPLFLVLGNEKLKPETSQSFHSSVKYSQTSGFFIEGSYFYHHIKDMIGYPSPFLQDPPVTKAQNLEKAWRSGSEAILGFQNKHLHTKVGYAYTDGEEWLEGHYQSTPLIIPHALTWSTLLFLENDLSYGVNGRFGTEREYPAQSLYKGEKVILLNTNITKGFFANRLKYTLGVHNILNKKTTEFNLQEGLSSYFKLEGTL